MPQPLAALKVPLGTPAAMTAAAVHPNNWEANLRAIAYLCECLAALHTTAPLAPGARCAAPQASILKAELGHRAVKPSQPIHARYTYQRFQLMFV